MNMCFNKLSSMLPILVFLVTMASCQTKVKELKFSGNTMGTTYKITILPEDAEVLQSEIDSVLVAFSACVSTYDSNSSLSRFNQGDTFAFRGQEFEWMQRLMARSTEINKLSNGAFDPSASALFSFWGFAGEEPVNPDSTKVDSLIQFTGMNQFAWQGQTLFKLDPRAALNFNAIAKGYGVDVLCDFLKFKGINDFMVEIGGELRCSGQNAEAKPWKIGINTPAVGSDLKSVFTMLNLNNAALATSGNYRNYYEKDGKKWVHTVNPATGFPQESDILSASVIASDCMTADALATACMVLGKDEALSMMKQFKGAEALFIYANEQGKFITVTTEGMKVFISE